MEDCFARLGLGRRAALSADRLQQAHHEAGEAAHPDREGGDDERAALVNQARQILEQPETRLKHLLELEAAEDAEAWTTVPMPESLMTVFLRLGPVLQKVDALAKKKGAASSALAKALLAPEEMELQEEIQQLTPEVDDLLEGLEAELPEIDALRAADDASMVRRTAELRARFAYVRKWKAQLQDAFLKLL